MALVVFNVNACLVVEWWSARVRDDEGVRTYLWYKLDHQLFRKSIRKLEECRLNECQFADDAVLLVTARA